ncbi:RNA-dependent RNA polymerase [Huangpi Tick Virus 2]|uniref:RNA-directed RNA polymerase L n=1 Tax=Huangpi Tick Virus 2 TaxID=1608048 RepID=A0A0B5KXU7_9VIRU|nr:RNA-dependent RNA polymerase [Huangpi Tick Virus 2]AJG39238.1 RNA-dependent RNA polymerase [Huangpi Tick Virus 2]
MFHRVDDLSEICRRSEKVDSLTVPDFRTYWSTVTLPPPLHHVYKDGSDIIIDFDLSTLDTSSQTGSSIRTTYKVKADDAGTLIHDFTFAHWSETTDEPLQNHFPSVRDDANRWTPDFISTRLDGIKDVVEFTTFRSVDERAARQRFMDKITKYEYPLELRSRATPGTLLFAICVFRGGVVTNLDLTDAEVDEVCFRFSVVQAVFATLQNQMLVQEVQDPEETRLERQVQQTFLRIQPEWDTTEKNFYPFTRDLYHSFQNGVMDEDYLRGALKHCYAEAKKDVEDRNFIHVTTDSSERIVLNGEEAAKSITEFVEAVDAKALRSDHDHKSTIPFPGIIPKVQGNTLSLSGLKDVSFSGITADSTGKAWAEAISRIHSDDVERADEHEELEREIALNGMNPDETEDYKKSRQQYHRVDLSNLDSSDRVELAKQGVEAKEFRDHPAIQQKRQESKRTFSLHADTSDIDCFLTEEGNLFDETLSQEAPPAVESCVESSARFQSLHGIDHKTNPWSLNVLSFLRLPIGVWLLMATCIGVELSISLKQHCGRRKFILKKLRFFDVYLLVKPTNSGSHVFYSVGFHKSAILGMLHSSNVFKAVKEDEGWCWTEFHSFKMSKLTNPVKALSSLCSGYWYWREFFEIPFWTGSTDDYSNNIRQANEMFKLTIMLLLEDKARTEEIVTLSRYIMMEGFKSVPELPKPHKMIEKLPTILRTKLQVWLTRKMLESISRVSQRPFQICNDQGTLYWRGMFNPFTGESIMSTQKLISLFYLGYLKNKEESPEQNASIKMYSKILEYELKHPGRYDYLGMMDPPADDCRYHEYSPSLIRLLCSTSIQFLRHQLGEGWRETLHKSIIHEIAHLDLEKLATLKASSKFDEKWYSYNPSETYHRSKVIERVADYVNDKTSHVFQILEGCLLKVESRGCMHICLFKKPQHGGLREIYVLGFEERVVQLVLETIARCICKHFPSETLTNPKHKLTIPESHGRFAMKICGNQHQTVGTSDDARTWNQGHHVSKFALLLMSFTKSELHPFVFRACSLFMKKRIMLDQNLLRILETNSNLLTDDETLRNLHSVYHGNEHVSWMTFKGGFIQTETGMMQGILHFTSSLFHTILQTWMKRVVAGSLKAILGINSTLNPHVDVLQSSDDSGMLVSFPTDDPTLTMRCRQKTATLFEYKRKVGKLIGIYPSVKSTSNTLFVLEFNSEFFFHTNHNRPVFRWIAAAGTISEQESLAARQEEMSNNLTSVLEGGGSFSLVSFCQYSQMLLHYVLLGMTVSPVFLEFMCSAREYMDPALGFFLMDPPFSPGLCGFKYNLWVACRKGRLGLKYRYFLNIMDGLATPEEKKASWKCLDTTSSGTFVQAVLIRWGDRKKWERLVKKVVTEDDWVDRIDENPFLLYRRPMTGQEVRLKLAVKMHSPGVASSLSKGNAVVRIIASSVYILTRAVLSDNLMMLEENRIAKKTSLLQRVLGFNGLLGSSGPHLTEDQFLLLFPHHQDYLGISDRLGQLRSIAGRFSAKKTHITQTRIEIIEKERFMKVRPEDLVSDMWFGTSRSRVNTKQFEKEWILLKTTVEWLRDTAEETLTLSPFSHHPALQNFFSRLETKGRSVRITGSPIKQRSGVSNMMTAVRDNFFPGFILSDVYDSAGLERSESAGLMRHCIFLILAGPYTEYRKTKMVEEVCCSLPTISFKLNQYKSRINSLALIQHFLKNPNDEKIFDHICNTNSGVIGGFTQPQKSRPLGQGRLYYGPGVWRGLVYGMNIQIEVNSPPDSDYTYLQAVTIDHDSSKDFLPGFLKTWCEEMNVTNLYSPRYSRSKKLLFFIYNFSVKPLRNPSGCPVYTESFKLFTNSSLRIDLLGFKVRSSVLNFRYYENERERGKSNGRGMNLVSFFSRDSDAGLDEASSLSSLMDQKIFSFSNNEPSTSWMTMRSLSSVSLNILLSKSSESHMLRAGIDKEVLKRCIKEALISSLKRMGVFLSDLKEAVDKMTDYAYTTAMEDCFNFAFEITEITSDDSDLFLNEPPQTAQWDPTDFELDMSDLGPFGSMAIEEATNTRFYHHRIMEDVARKMVATLGHRGVRDLIINSTYPRVHKELVQEWCSYLEINFESLAAKEEEAFGIALGPVIGLEQIG